MSKEGSEWHEAKRRVDGQEYVIIRSPSQRMATAAEDMWTFLMFCTPDVLQNKKNVLVLGQLGLRRQANLPALLAEGRRRPTEEEGGKKPNSRRKRKRDEVQEPADPTMIPSIYRDRFGRAGPSRFDSHEISFLGDPMDSASGFIGDGRTFIPPESFRLVHHPQIGFSLDDLLNVADEVNKRKNTPSVISDESASVIEISDSEESDNEDDGREGPHKQPSPEEASHAQESDGRGEGGDGGGGGGGGGGGEAPEVSGAEDDSVESDGRVKGSAWWGRKDQEEVVSRQREWLEEAVRSDSGSSTPFSEIGL